MLKTTQKITGTFESFDGTPIYFEIRGQGRPIIMCYGIGCLINHWRFQLEHFAHRYQTIVFDYRGHHKTPIPKNRDFLSFDALAQDMKKLCEHLQLEKASFWGHSFGAQVLIRTYDMFPEIFSNLIMINGFASNPLANLFGMDVVPNSFRLIKKTFENFPETLSYLWRIGVNNPLAIYVSAFAGGFNRHLTHLKDIEIYAKGVENIDLKVFLTFFEQMLNYDGSPVLDRIDVPTLIVSGSKDKVTPVEYQETLHNRIKGSQLFSVPYGSHCTQLDLPEFVNLRIEKFLAETEY